MKNYIIYFMMLLAVCGTASMNAQVTIGHLSMPDSNALLDLKQDEAGASSKGMLLPRVPLEGKNSPNPLSEHKAGMVVYNTATVAGPNGVMPGIYINNGTGWIMLDESAPIWLQRGTTDPAKTDAHNIYHTGSVTVGTMYSPANAVFHIDGNKDNSSITPNATQAANDFVVTQSGSVGIGTTTPNTSAILDISSANKGILGPRVELTSNTDHTTVALTPADAGMLVYNTGSSGPNTGLSFKGYVVWTGTEWRTLTGASLSNGIINTLVVNGAVLSPATYGVNQPYTGTLNIAYTGSNGGVYGEMTITGYETDNPGTPSGLTAHLSSGNFSPGAGTLSFTVTGTPTLTSPSTTTFHIDIGGKSGDVIIGAGDGIAPGDLVYYVTPELSASTGGTGDPWNGNDDIGWLNSLVNAVPGSTPLPIIGGKLRLDGYFNGASTAATGANTFNPRLVNITNNPIKLWFSAITTVNRFNSANIVLKANGGWVNLDDGIYFSSGNNATIGSPTGTNNGVLYTGGVTGRGNNGFSVPDNTTEVVTVDLCLDDKWYRIYYYPIVDNKDQTSTAGMRRKIYLSVQRLY